jgi:hypothetical protein
MSEEYAIHLGRSVPDHGGPPRWIGRTYDADGNHIHSTEGGAELTVCVTEALRAIQSDVEEVDDPPCVRCGAHQWAYPIEPVANSHGQRYIECVKCGERRIPNKLPTDSNAVTEGHSVFPGTHELPEFGELAQPKPATQEVQPQALAPWDARHPKGSIQAHPCPDCNGTGKRQPEDERESTEEATAKLRRLTDRQAEDPDLWQKFPPNTISRKLQTELRRLHEAIQVADELATK